MIRRNSFVVCFMYSGVIDGERAEGVGRLHCLTKTKHMRWKDVQDFEKYQRNDLKDKGYTDVYVTVTSISRLQDIPRLENTLERAKKAKSKLIEIASEKMDKWRNRKIVKECKEMKLERERREEQTLKEIREERE